MKHIGYTDDNRPIFYINARNESNWIERLPFNDWALFIVGDERDTDEYYTLAEECLDKNVRYISITGRSAELIKDIFYETICEAKTKDEEDDFSKYDFTDMPEVYHFDNFDEAFWFSTFNTEKNISVIVCIDYTANGVKNYLLKLIDKLNSGWTPKEEEHKVPIYDVQLS